MDRLKSGIEQMLGRVDLVRGKGEAATKQALVLKMLEALGYDVWNPQEVFPEFEGDFATKKQGQKEKVDIAVLMGGTPRIFVEAKPLEMNLDGHEGQLARYFNAVPSVALGVLTNGAEYRFYSDTGEPNIMDSRPFFSFRLDAPDARLDTLLRFSKEHFDADAIRDFAMELFHTANIVAFLRGELDLRGRPPSEAFIRWTLAGESIYDGRVTANVVDRFRPIVANALNSVLRDVVRRSVAALDQGVVEPVPAVETATAEAAPPDADATAEPSKSKGGIFTTDEELAGFEQIRVVLEGAGLLARTLVDASTKKTVPVELGYKDTTAYFGVYLNKPGWWFARLFLDRGQPWIGLNGDADALRPLVPPGVALVEDHPAAALGVRLEGTSLPELAEVILAAAAAIVDARQ